MVGKSPNKIKIINILPHHLLDESQRSQLIEAVESDFKEIHRRTEEARMLANRIEVRKQLEAVLPFINVSAFTNEEIGILSSSLREVGSHLMDSANTLQPRSPHTGTHADE